MWTIKINGSRPYLQIHSRRGLVSSQVAQHCPNQGSKSLPSLVSLTVKTCLFVWPPGVKTNTQASFQLSISDLNYWQLSRRWPHFVVCPHFCIHHSPKANHVWNKRLLCQQSKRSKEVSEPTNDAAKPEIFVWKMMMSKNNYSSVALKMLAVFW